MSRGKYMTALAVLAAVVAVDFVAVQSADAQLLRRRSRRNCCNTVQCATTTCATNCNTTMIATPVAYQAPVQEMIVTPMEQSDCGCGTTSVQPMMSTSVVMASDCGCPTSTCDSGCGTQSDCGSCCSDTRRVRTRLVGNRRACCNSSCGSSRQSDCGTCCDNSLVRSTTRVRSRRVMTAGCTQSNCGCATAMPVSYGAAMSSGCQGCGQASYVEGAVISNGSVIQGCPGGNCGGGGVMIENGSSDSAVPFEAPSDATQTESGSGQREV